MNEIATQERYEKFELEVMTKGVLIDYKYLTTSSTLRREKFS